MMQLMQPQSNTEILMNTQVVLGLSSTIGVAHRGSKKTTTSDSKHRFDKTFSRKKKDIATASASATATDKNNNPDKPKPTKITIKFTQQPPKKLNPKPEKQDNVGVGSSPKPEKEEVLINLKKKKKKRKVENEDVGVGKKMKMKVKTEAKENEDEEEGLECVFPTARITRIIKSQGFDCKITAEAVFLINKATEKFIELFSEDAYGCAVEDHKNFVGYKHLSSAVSKGNLFDFLSDFVPEKVTAEKALAERNPPPTQPC